jgi:hypothetical protein
MSFSKNCPDSGLPDGLVSNQTPSFGTFWKVFELEIFIYFITILGTLCGQLFYFMSIWYILWPIVLFYVHLVYIVAICYIIPILVFFIKKNLATLPRLNNRPPGENSPNLVTLPDRHLSPTRRRRRRRRLPFKSQQRLRVLVSLLRFVEKVAGR